MRNKRDINVFQISNCDERKLYLAKKTSRNQRFCYAPKMIKSDKNLKKGSLSEFFDSVRESAREIDQGKRLTPKNTIWVQPSDEEKSQKIASTK